MMHVQLPDIGRTVRELVTLLREVLRAFSIETYKCT